LNLESDILKGIHAELLLVGLALSLTVVRPFAKDAWSKAMGLAAAFLALAPIFTSLATDDFLLILQNEEYRSWLKALIAAPLLFGLYRGTKGKQRLVDLLLFSVGTFELVFLYRFFVLGEAREFDGRPTLHTKNGDPNFICTFFAFALPFALYRLVEAMERRRWKQATGYGLLSLFFLYGAAVTESRMGLLSILAALVYLGRSSRVARAGLVALALAAALYGSAIGDRFKTLDDESSHGRVKSYLNGLLLFMEKPALGNGWDTSAQTYFANTGYPLFRSDAHAISVHDTPLQLAADLGLYGLIAYLWLCAIAVRAVGEGLRRKNRLAVFSAAALLALSMNYLTLPLATKDFAILFLAMVAALNVIPAPQSDETATRPCPSSFPREDEPLAVPAR
jgi:hypothetical protein